MADPRVNLKNRPLAATLAYLLPGAGHAYQGRWFKATIYSVGIWGLFLWGLALGEGNIVYFRWQAREKTVGYLSQVLVGLPALPALVQSYRYSRESDLAVGGEGSSEFPISAPFEGYVKRESSNPDESLEGAVRGRIELRREEPRQFGPEIRGEFRGRLTGDAGRDIELQLAQPFEIAPRVFGGGNAGRRLDGGNRDKELSGSERYLKCRVVEQRREFDSPVGELTGTIPRPFWNWFQVPLEDEAVQDLNRRLGKRYEIALLFTWIAGLLNLLAVWDAYEGPAYGYGDEVEQPDGQHDNKSPAAGTPAPVAAVVNTPAKT